MWCEPSCVGEQSDEAPHHRARTSSRGVASFHRCVVSSCHRSCHRVIGRVIGRVTRSFHSIVSSVVSSVVSSNVSLYRSLDRSLGRVIGHSIVSSVGRRGASRGDEMTTMGRDGVGRAMGHGRRGRGRDRVDVFVVLALGLASTWTTCEVRGRRRWRTTDTSHHHHSVVDASLERGARTDDAHVRGQGQTRWEKIHSWGENRNGENGRGEVRDDGRGRTTDTRRAGERATDGAAADAGRVQRIVRVRGDRGIGVGFRRCDVFVFSCARSV